MGDNDENGMLSDAFEQTQPREEAVMNDTLASGKIPSLTEIANMQLKVAR